MHDHRQGVKKYLIAFVSRLPIVLAWCPCIMHHVAMDVKQMLKRLGKNHSQIARAVGVHRTTIMRVMEDRIDAPHKVIASLLKLQNRELRRRRK